MTTFSTRELPWMKLGTTIDRPVDSAEAAKLGGLDFEIELADAGYRRVSKNGETSGPWQAQPDRRAVVRVDTGDFYGYCSTDYQPVQYSEAFSFMDAINPKYVSAGTLRGGKQGFMVVKLPEHSAIDLSLAGEKDPHDLYVIIRASHDMSKGIEVAVTTLRGKCMNMLTLPSLTADAPQRWSIRHVGDPQAKLRQAQEVLAQTDRYEQAFRSCSAARCHRQGSSSWFRRNWCGQTAAPCSRRQASCALVSTPSATTASPRLCASEMMARAMATLSVLSGRSATNERSSFSVSTGRRFK